MGRAYLSARCRHILAASPTPVIEDGLAALFSGVATTVSGVFAVTLLRRFVRRGGRPLLYWGLSLGMFCLASLMLLLGVVGGWTSGPFRAFYLFGAVLNVPWLAMGSVAVNADNRAVTRTTGAFTLTVAGLLGWALVAGASPPLLVPGLVLGVLWGLVQLIGDPDGVRAGSVVVLGLLTLAGVLGVLSAELVAPLPTSGLPEGSELFPPLIRGLAVAGNAVGAAIVVLGALASVAHLAWGSAGPGVRRRLRETGRRAPVEAAAGFVLRGTRAVRHASLGHLAGGNLMIALGVLIAAAGGAFSFLGETTGHAVGLGLGVVVMYLGFVRTTRPVAAGGPEGRGTEPGAPRGDGAPDIGRTSPRPAPRVDVYTRQGCGLCRKAERLVAAEAGRAEIRHIDIDEDPQLQERYTVRVPVVVVDGREVSEGRLEPGEVTRAIRRVRRGRWATWRQV